VSTGRQKSDKAQPGVSFASSLTAPAARPRFAPIMPDSAARSVRVPSRARQRSFLVALRLKAFGRRRRLLVDRNYQLRSALRSVLGTSVLVGLLVFVLYRINLESSLDLQQMAPFMREGLRRWDRITLFSLILGGLVFLAGVFLVELMETHRTAGALHNLRRRLEELRCGRFTAQLKLRRHDNFPELEKAFNDVVASLRSRTEGEVATLGRLSAQARDLLREQDQGNPSRVRILAEALQQSLEEMRCRKSDLLEP